MPRSVRVVTLRPAAVLCLAAAAACSDAVAPSVPQPSYAVAPQGAQSASTLVTFFGPERFIRDRGAPQTFTRTIATTGYLPPFVLHVRSGDASGANAVSSGSVTLDGVTLLPPNAFTSQGRSWAFPVTLGPTAQVSVSLASAPGSHLDLWIEGQLANLFCPGGPASSHHTLEAAIAATPAGGTLRVCDGTFNVDSVVVNKPLTIRSQNPGGATLGDMDRPTSLQGGRPALAINGVSAGTVRLVDLGFAMRGRGIIATGTYDRIEIDSARFYGRDSTTSIGVMAFPTTVPTAVVNVSHSRFEHMAIGVFPVANVEFNTRSSVFERFNNGAVTYSAFGLAPAGTQSSHGRIEDNVFRSCGQSGCIRALNPGRDLVVARNRLENPTGSDKLAAIYIIRGSWERVPIVVEDNEIVGAATGGDPTQFAGWTVRTGIAITDAAGVVNIVRRNRISGVYQGLLVSSDVDARDNVVTGGYQAFQRIAPGAATIQRNDFVGQLRAFQAPTSGGDYRCNWWGSASGPTAPPANMPGSYAPWATQPIAGTTNPCDPVQPTVVQVCVASVDGGPMTVPAVAEAVALVADGGTVLVCEGTHQVRSVNVTRPVTIRGVGPSKPTFDGGGTGFVLNVRGPIGGTVRIASLQFKNGTWAEVMVQSTTDSVVIEGSDFYPGSQPGDAWGTYAGVKTQQASLVLIRDNAFIGGNIGVSPHQSSRGVTILNNTFTNQGVAIHAGDTSDVRVVGNSFSQCSMCIGTFDAGGSGGRMDIIGNTIRADISHPTGNGFQLGVGTYEVRDNVFTGTGGARDPSNNLTWPIQTAAIAFAGTIRASGNRISGAYNGISLGGESLRATGTDNVISDVGAVMNVYRAISVELHRNDFTSLGPPIRYVFEPGTVSLQCNWWGSPGGPQGASQWSSMDAPWATQPIAGTTNPCDPSAPVTAMRVCATVSVGGPMTVPTIPEAIALVTDGGTVRLCDGTHHASNVQLGNKSLTITAEGPGVPTVHGDDAPVTFNVWSTGGEARAGRCTRSGCRRVSRSRPGPRSPWRERRTPATRRHPSRPCVCAPRLPSEVP